MVRLKNTSSGPVLPDTTHTTPPKKTSSKRKFSQVEDNGGQRTVVSEKLKEHKEGKYYNDLLKLEEDSKPLDPTDAAELEASREKVPAILYRTYSQVSRVVPNEDDDHARARYYRRTNGRNEETKFLPAADDNGDWNPQPTIYTMSQGVARYMIGRHLLWYDIKGDELLSWTRSILFAFEHALGRLDRGESQIFIAMVDTRTARNLEDKPAAIYYALDLWREFKVIHWTGWSKLDRDNLVPRKFTHEYLSYGPVKPDSMWRDMPLEDLINQDIFKLFPELGKPKGFARTKLYTRLVALRKAWFPAPTFALVYLYSEKTRCRPITTELLEQCSTMAQDFIKPQSGEEVAKAPLHAFLSIVGLCKRESRDPSLMAWIRQHYTATDLTFGFFEGFSSTANNLLEVQQYIDLVRDACVALDVPMIPDTVLETCEPSYKPINGTNNHQDEDRRLSTKVQLWISKKLARKPRKKPVSKQLKNLDQPLSSDVSATMAAAASPRVSPEEEEIEEVESEEEDEQDTTADMSDA